MRPMDEARVPEMNVLITGGAGFIGSHVVDLLLEQGHDVRVLDSLDPQVHAGVPEYLNPQAELIHADVRDRDAVGVALAGVDRVAHLAAAVGVGQSMYEIERYTSVNSLGAAVLLEEILAARERVEKMVVASSMSIYGEGLYRCDAEELDVSPGSRPDGQLRAKDWEPQCPSCGKVLRAIPTTESTPVTPESIYAIGKRDHEEMFLVVGRAYAIPATALRFFNVYGPRQALSNPYTGVSAIFSSRLLGVSRPSSSKTVRRAGTSSMFPTSRRRSLRHLARLGRRRGRECRHRARGHHRGSRRGPGRELGVDTESEVRNAFRAGDIRHCFADIGRARALLDYQPSVSFEDGMRELVNWLGAQTAVDRVDEATAALEQRGLTF